MFWHNPAPMCRWIPCSTQTPVNNFPPSTSFDVHPVQLDLLSSNKFVCLVKLDYLKLGLMPQTVLSDTDVQVFVAFFHYELNS